MEELLRVIEQLKQAYIASGAKSVKVEFDCGDTKCILINKQKYALENIPKKPLTNRAWLESLSDEQFVYAMGNILYKSCAYANENKYACDRFCYTCELAWLRAEHKGVE